MKILAPAKINLFLKILKKDKKDGYHFIKSIFSPISLYDILIFKKIKQNKILVIDKNKVLNIPIKKNLVYKAAKMIFDYAQINNQGIKIELYKNIPEGSGLGGGSSDAAATLLALNKLFKLNLSLKNLKRFAFKLGSDVPFFLFKKTSLIEGKGEKIKIIKNFQKFWAVLFVPNLKISTKKAYEWFDKEILANKKKKLTNNKKYIIIKKNIFLYNDFFYIILKKYSSYYFKVLKEMKKFTDFVSLSGSGSTIFALFETKKHAISLYKTLLNKYKKGRFFLVKIID